MANDSSSDMKFYAALNHPPELETEPEDGEEEWSDLPSLVSNSDSEELVHAEFDDNDIIIFDDIQIYGGHVTNEYQLRGLPHAHIILTPPRPSLH